MSIRRFLQLSSILLVLTTGLWLLSRPGMLQPEGVSRQRALRALASIGNGPGAGPGAGPGDVAIGQTAVHEPVEPVVVDFSNIDVHTDETDSVYQQWLNGEIDLNREATILSEAELAALRTEALEAPRQENVQEASTGPGQAAPTLGTSFDAIYYSGLTGGSVPPDPELAVGPNQIIAVVNVGIAIYDKSGAALLPPVHASNLFSQPPCRSGLYDPNVLYDEEADRWIIAYDSGVFSSSGGYCLLASKSGDPLGLWNEYFFQLNNRAAWLDFPQAGVGDNNIFMSGNMFDYNGYFVDGRIFAFNKFDLYNGRPVAAIQASLGNALSTPQPLNLQGYETYHWSTYRGDHYFLADEFNGQHYTLIRWNPATYAFSIVGDIDLGANAYYPISVPQNGSGELQSNDWRPLDFEYRNGYGWTTMTISCNLGSDQVNCVRWAQIDLSVASLGPAGTGIYGSNDQHRFVPDIAVNHCNDMAIGYTKSSSTMYPSIWVTGRKGTDPVNMLQAEVQLKAGEVPYQSFGNDPSPHRWGDYTGMTVDPDGRTFWYIGEYSRNNAEGVKWGTYIGSFTFDCSVPPPPTLDKSIFLPMFTR